MRGSLTAPRLLTLLLFLLLVAICSYWALQILAPRPAIAPSASIGDATAAPNLAPALVLFGSSSAVAAGVPTAPSNIQVSGIAEAGPNGVVILSIDGRPGVAYGIDESVSDGTTVKSVGLDKVVLDQRGRLIELKSPDRASRDVLSSGVGKPRTPSVSSTTPPVAARPVLPPPLPAPAPPPPQFQPPQPPQQVQPQQVQPPAQPPQQSQGQPAASQYQPGAAQMPGMTPGGLPGGGPGPMQGGLPPPNQSTAVSGQQQAPGQWPAPGQVLGQQPNYGQQPAAQ